MRAEHLLALGRVRPQRIEITAARERMQRVIAAKQNAADEIGVQAAVQTAVLQARECVAREGGPGHGGARMEVVAARSRSLGDDAAVAIVHQVLDTKIRRGPPGGANVDMNGTAVAELLQV